MKRLDRMDELSQAEQNALMEEIDAFYAEQFGPLDDESEPESGPEPEPEFEPEFEDWAGPELSAELRKSLADFAGVGGALRFDDGTLELEVVADPLLGGFNSRYDGTDGLAAVAALPADTVLAFGGGLAEGWAERAATDNPIPFAGGGESEAELLTSFEESTGLTVDDLQSLGGDRVAFAAGPGFERAIESGTVADVPIAARVTGDTAKIEAALVKLTAKGQIGEFLESERTDDGVVIGPNASYLEDLVSPAQTLGDSDVLESAVPQAEDAVVVAYASFEDGAWTDFASEGAISQADAEALDAVGTSVTKDGSWNRLLTRLSLD